MYVYQLTNMVRMLDQELKGPHKGGILAYVYFLYGIPLSVVLTGSFQRRDGARKDCAGAGDVGEEHARRR